MKAFRLLAPLLASLALTAAPAVAETRVALVIGNSAYRHAPALANPKNDAEGMAASLKRLGFEVLAGTDLDEAGMRSLLQSFARKLDGADVALTFYAGHGLQVNGRNYLVPVDAKLEQESDLVFQAVPLDLIQGLMEQSQRTNIMILDACRDNPLARNLARSMGTRSTGIGRGLGEAKAGIGTLIVYATQPGNVALDGDQKNSPFTLALLKHMEAPGLEIRQVLTRVRNDVITATRDKQVPWDSSSLRGDFFFAAAPGTPPPAPGPAPAPPQADGDIVFWQSIQNSKNAADYKAYLEKYPNGTFAALAKLRIAEIEKAAVVTPTPAPEKPAPPAGPPRRTSTFVANLDIRGELHTSASDVASRQACAALCIGEPRCVAWTYWTDQNPLSKRACYTYTKAQPGTRDTHAQPHRYSGFIRTTPEAAPAPQPAAPKPAPASPGIADIAREFKRKAERKEPDSGICAKTNWPVLPWAENGFDPYLRRLGESGGTIAFRYPNSGSYSCMIISAAAAQELREGVLRCRTLFRWMCSPGLLGCYTDRAHVVWYESKGQWSFNGIHGACK